MEGTVVVFAGGQASHVTPVPRNPQAVIAADSGYRSAVAMGCTVDVLIGDLDSIDPDDLAHAETHDVEIVRYPEDKDATDLELALDHANALGADRIVVVGGGGGQIAHLLANALLLAAYNGDVEWRNGRETAFLVSGTLVFGGSRGDLVSIVPVGGEVVVRSTSGLRWPLIDSVLPLGTTRGVSNVMTDEQAAVEIDQGAALVVHERIAP